MQRGEQHGAVGDAVRMMLTAQYRDDGDDFKQQQQQQPRIVALQQPRAAPSASASAVPASGPTIVPIISEEKAPSARIEVVDRRTQRCVQEELVPPTNIYVAFLKNEVRGAAHNVSILKKVMRCYLGFVSPCYEHCQIVVGWNWGPAGSTLLTFSTSLTTPSEFRGNSYDNLRWRILEIPMVQEKRLQVFNWCKTQIKKPFNRVGFYLNHCWPMTMCPYDSGGQSYYCFTTDHEILTDKGFLSLDHFEMAVTHDMPLMVAAYDAAGKRFRWRPFTLIVNRNKPQQLVEITGNNGVSLLVTHDHRMYVRTKSSGYYTTVQAGALVHGDAYRNIKLLASAENGVQDDGRFPAPTLETLGLADLSARRPKQMSPDTQLLALLELLGAALVSAGDKCQAPCVTAVRLRVGLRYATRVATDAVPGARCVAADDDALVSVVEDAALAAFVETEVARATALGNTWWIWRLPAPMLRAIVRGVFATAVISRGSDGRLVTTTQSATIALVVQRAALLSGSSVSISRSGSAWEMVLLSDTTALMRTGMLLHPAMPYECELDIVSAGHRTGTGRHATVTVCTTWCVSVPPEALICVRRRLRDSCGGKARPDRQGDATAASTPVIVGNCAEQVSSALMHVGIDGFGEDYVVARSTPDEVYSMLRQVKDVRAVKIRQYEPIQFLAHRTADVVQPQDMLFPEAMMMMTPTLGYTARLASYGSSAAHYAADTSYGFTVAATQEDGSLGSDDNDRAPEPVDMNPPTPQRVFHL